MWFFFAHCKFTEPASVGVFVVGNKKAPNKYYYCCYSNNCFVLVVFFFFNRIFCIFSLHELRVSGCQLVERVYTFCVPLLNYRRNAIHVWCAFLLVCLDDLAIYKSMKCKPQNASRQWCLCLDSTKLALMFRWIPPDTARIDRKLISLNLSLINDVSLLLPHRALVGDCWNGWL